MPSPTGPTTATAPTATGSSATTTTTTTAATIALLAKAVYLPQPDAPRLGEVARMFKDGERNDDDEYEMGNDEALDLAHEFIDTARELCGIAGPGWFEPKP